MYKNVYYNLTVENAAEGEKKTEVTPLNEDQQNENFIDVDHVTELLTLKCWACHLFFQLNNKLHKHLQTGCHHNVVKTTLNTDKVIMQSLMKTASTFSTSLISVSIYIKSTTMNELNLNDYRFWDWCYTTAEAQLLTDVSNQPVYLNISCTMTLIDRQVLRKQVPDMIIHCILLSIPVWELEVTVHQSAQYAKVDMYLLRRNDYTAVVLWEIHIVEDLKTKMLININILMSEDIIMNLSRKVITIESCDNIEISLTIITKSTNQINHMILMKQWIIISLWSNLTVTVLQLSLLCNHNFLFELDCCQADISVYVHIVDHTMKEVHVWNDSNVLLIISWKFHMSQIIKYKVNSCFLIMSEDSILVSSSQCKSQSWTQTVIKDLLTAVTVFYTSMDDSLFLE